MTKAQRIKESLRKTKERRKDQKAVVYQLKIQNLTKRKEKLLERAFLEAKWLYNFLVRNPEYLENAHKLRSVMVKVGDHFEERELKILGSQIKQGIADRIKDNAKRS